MNPSLPGGAIGAQDEAAGASWAASTRLGYAFVPYGRLQQGREPAANPNELRIDVHLGTLQAKVDAPTGTSLDLQLPFGSLVTRTIRERRADHGVGDLELRVRQALPRWAWAPRLSLGVTAGLVVPTGPYVERSGAANLPPEASYLTLGRGATWWVAEGDARAALSGGAALFAQVAARGPMGRTRDGFAWGREVRGAVGARAAVGPRWLALLATAEVQWRGGASEPDPFSSGRLASANAGGWQVTASPAVAVALPGELSLLVGARVPLRSDVRGNQLVPQTGGFAALAFVRRAPPRPAPMTARAPRPARGVITVVDYWASWCAPCEEISRRLAAAAPRWPSVVIVKVDASAWPGPGAPRLPDGVTGLPVVEVYDERGVRAALLVGEDAATVVERVDALRARGAAHSLAPVRGRGVLAHPRRSDASRRRGAAARGPSPRSSVRSPVRSSVRSPVRSSVRSPVRSSVRSPVRSSLMHILELARLKKGTS